MKRLMTTADKLQAVERLIEDLRWARNDPSAPEHLTWLALKAIASDLRASGQDAGADTHDRLRTLIDLTLGSGYRSGHCRALAGEVIALWPVVSRALIALQRRQT